MNKALLRQIHHARHALALTVAVGVLGMAVTIAQMVLLSRIVGRDLPQLALSVVIPLVVAAFVFLQDWVSAVVLLATAPIIPLLMALVGRYAEGHIQRQWTALARMSAHFLDALQGLPTLVVFG